MTNEELIDGLYDIKNWHCNGDERLHTLVTEAIKALERSSAYYHGGWIPVSERLPEMNKEDGLLKKFTKERSDEVLVTIKDNNNGSVVVHSGCELWDGEWHGDIFRWLEASKCDYTVIAWMPLPEAYKESEANT